MNQKINFIQETDIERLVKKILNEDFLNENFLYEDVYGSVEEIEDFIMESEYQ